MQTQVDGRHAAWWGLGLWVLLWPLVLWQLPAAGQRCLALFHPRPDAVGAEVRLVVIAPVAVTVRTAVQSDGGKTSVAVAGFDAQGCLRYAGASEALPASSVPLPVYLRPLPFPDCLGSPVP